MQIKVLSSLWGYDTLDLEACLDKIRAEGFDGIDTSLPADEGQRGFFLNYLHKYGLCLVVQQHEAQGNTFEEYKQSFFHYLEISAEANPMLINSHTGRDYYTYEQNLELIDIAQSFSEKRGVEIIHETHRGRFGYSPLAMSQYFSVRPGLKITADFSHWTCVTESFLEGFSDILHETIARARHVHARIGYEESPQVPDPCAPEWQYAKNYFLNWWDKIVEERQQQGSNILTFTAEFGPTPYMQTIPFSNKPIADLFEINCYMKDLLKSRYAL